jgi:hypothetical protein
VARTAQPAEIVGNAGVRLLAPPANCHHALRSQRGAGTAAGKFGRQRWIKSGATMFHRVIRRVRRRDARATHERVASAGKLAARACPRIGRIREILTVVSLVAAASFMASNARAAGAAYAVETSEVSAAGSCKVESWASWASNRDFIGVGNPSCVVDVGRPVEFSAAVFRSRADEEWSTGIAPKAKTKIIPSAIGSFGLAIAGQAFFDLTTQENTAIFVNVPATLRLSDVVRINVNGGWLWDRIVDRHYAFYGLGVDWRTPDNVWTLTAEVFGFAGPAQEVSTVTQPRFQTGLRWRPIDIFSIDFVYGRNLFGENANWITVATTIRFPPPGGKAGE